MNPEIHISGPQKLLHISGRRIHSKYNPVAEAERFVQRMPECSILILLGASIGYITDALKKLRPQTKVLALYLHRDIYEASDKPPDCIWYPDAELADIETNISAFLFHHIPEYYLNQLHVLEWKPMIDCFPELQNCLYGAIQRTVRQLRGNIYTSGYFGKRWIQNSIVNYLSDNIQVQLQCRDDLPVAILAPGWSLRDKLPFIARYRKNMILLALSSTVEILLREGIQPDCIIHSDGGYWAARYLDNIPEIPLICPLRARLPRSSLLVSFCSQGFLMEHDIGEKENLLPITEHPTVTGLAIEIALHMTRRAIIFFGLDLAAHDILGHARGHTSERYITAATHRMQTADSRYFVQHVKEAQEHSPLNMYADWFQEYMKKTLPVSVLRVGQSANTDECREYFDKEAKLYLQRKKMKPLQERQQLLLAVLQKWEGLLYAKHFSHDAYILMHRIAPTALHQYLQQKKNSLAGERLRTEVMNFLTKMRKNYCE